MANITIEDKKFTCPMMGKEISERGEIMFATCAKCKWNSLHQFVDDVVYCSYGSSAGEGSEDEDHKSDNPNDYWITQ